MIKPFFPIIWHKIEQAACSTVSVGITIQHPKNSSIYMKKDGKRQLIMNFLAGFTYKKENIRANQASRKAILYDTKTILRN